MGIGSSYFLITQCRMGRMLIGATEFLSIHDDSLPGYLYTSNNEGHNPARTNSLFEYNVEYGSAV